MAYKMKIMTEAQQNEINELAANGHSDALVAFGWECVNAWRTGFRQGVMKSCVRGAVGVAAVVAVCGVIELAAEAIENRKKQKQLIEEQQDYEE